VQEAAAGVGRALREVDAPLMRLKALPAKVEVAVADGDLKTARAAADELERVVDAHRIGDRRTPAFDAAVQFAFGKIKLAEGDSDGAARCLRRAREEWRQVGAPYETAQARTLLGLAYRRQGDESAAVSELEAALTTFERLGARLEEERVKELLGRLETRRTFLFSDIVDSTKLLENLGDAKWKKLLARHDELTREAIAAAGGEVIKSTGDGFFAAFDGPKAALEAAVAVDRALDAEVYAPDVRIGIHTGGAFHTGGDVADYGGQGVHAAARIAAAAGAGEILISRATLEGAQTAFAVSESRLEALKGFDESAEVVSVEWR
jgi:class 3 adenylate cyclase